MNPRIIFIDSGGSEHVLEGTVGYSAMEVARKSEIAGIVAECGGACSCATCHVHVDSAWIEQTGTASEAELDLLELSDQLRPNSRLSCQITITPDLDGVILRIPPVQG